MFGELKTFRVAYPECCGLAEPNAAEALLLASEQVDSLSGYTPETWDILTDVVLKEWFGVRLPSSKTPWEGPIYLPPHVRLVYCLDRASARQVRSDIHAHYPVKREYPEISVFSGCGLSIPDDLELEREGLDFIARQSEHFRSPNDYLFITQEVTHWPD